MHEFLRQQKFIKLNSVPWDCFVQLERGYCLFKDDFKRHFTNYLGVWVLKILFWTSTKCMGVYLLLFSSISLRKVCAITYPSVIPIYLLVNLNSIWHRTTELKTSIWFWAFKIHGWVERKVYTTLKEKLLQELRSYLFFLNSRMTQVDLNPGNSCSLLPRW